MGLLSPLPKRQHSVAGSVYESIGGRQTLDVIVEDFYARVLADDQLAPFFCGTNLSRLKARQAEFFAVLLGEPRSYAGATMKQAHRGRGITMHHFDLVTDYLTDSLLAAGVPAQTVTEFLGLIAPLAADIASDAATATI